MNTNNTALPSHARSAGWMLVAMTVVAIVAEFLTRQSMFVQGDSAATAANIMAAPGRFTIGLLAYITTFVLDVFVAVHLYKLFVSVNRTRSLMALSFRLVYTGVVSSFLLLFALAGIFLNTDLLAGLEIANQASELSYLMISLFGEGFSLALILFGFHLVYIGLLSMESGVLPKWLGLLVLLGGLSYPISGLLHFSLPSLEAALKPLFALLGMMEPVFAVFLIVKAKKFTE